MASAGAMVLASFALPPNLRRILDDRPAALAGAVRPGRPISEIKHIVVLMQENRSFDHYFGTMPGVRRPGHAGPDPERPAAVGRPEHRRHGDRGEHGH
jgi:phospholipase C